MPCYPAPQQGRLAQLGEHQLDKLGVTGSSPVTPTLGERSAYVGLSSFGTSLDLGPTPTDQLRGFGARGVGNG